MSRWVTLLRDLPQSREQLVPFIQDSTATTDFLSFITQEYPQLPEELRRRIERNLTTRKGGRFLDLLQSQANPTLRSWALAIVNLLPAEERIPRLFQALDDKDEGIKLEASAALGKMKNTKVVSLLLEGLKEDRWLPARVAQALWDMGEFALPYIVDLTNSPQQTLRLYAVELLEQFNSPLAGQALLQLLKDNSPKVRGRAAGALLFFRDLAPGQALVNALETEQDRQTKLCIIRALGRLGDKTAQEALRREAAGEDLKIARAARTALQLINLQQE